MKIVTFYLQGGEAHSVPIDENTDYVDLIEYVNGDYFFVVKSPDGTKLCVNSAAVDVYVIGEGVKKEEA